jgi:uncharacterized protein YegP (UPF0339 family)
MNTLRLALIALAVSLTACGIDDASTMEGDTLDGADSALTTTVGKFETFTGQDGKVYFHLLAANGEKVLASQGYTSLSSAKAGIASVKTNGVDQAKYLLREASDGSRYFVLTAANGQIIGMSEMYSSQAAANGAIGTVMRIVADTVAQNPAVAGSTHFDVFRGIDGKYYFHLKANNGQIILQSQAYTARASATAGANSVAVNGIIAARYQVLAAADGSFFFRLRAANGQLIGRGQLYTTQASAEAGVTACINVLNNKG